MKKTVPVIVVVFLLAFIGFMYGPLSSTPTITQEPTIEDEPNETVLDNLIRLDIPEPNAIVTSPLRIEGIARGYWFFEASFPIRIFDANGMQLGVVPAQAQGEWMTEDFVPFSADLIFDTPTTATGTLILEKDNPSGLPEHADERRIPIRFE